MYLTLSASSCLDSSTALLSREETVILPFSHLTTARLMEVSVRPAILWLILITFEGQAIIALRALSITSSWMYLDAGRSCLRTTACIAGSLSLYLAVSWLKVFLMLLATAEAFPAGTTMSASPSKGMALRRLPPLRLATLAPYLVMTGMRAAASTLLALAL